MRLRVNNLSFSYSSHVALADASFSLEPGEIMCILGPNGAGKSTLLKCLNKLLLPQSGILKLGKNDIAAMELQDLAKNFGYVPQRHPLTKLTVFETVLLGRMPYMDFSFASSDYEFVEEVLSQLALGHLAMRSIVNLSGGELQKVIIARALAQNPNVLLLDEPTSNLDLKNQIEVIDLLRKIVSANSLSALVAIHDINMALRFADKFLFLKEHSVFSIVDKSALTDEIFQEVYGVEVKLHQVANRQIALPL